MTPWSQNRVRQVEFINALRAVLGLLPLYEPPQDEDEARMAKHPGETWGVGRREIEELPL